MAVLGPPGEMQIANVPPVERQLSLELPDSTKMSGPNSFLVPPSHGQLMTVNTGTRVYSYRYDEAMYNSFVNARAMRRDAFIRSLMEERLLPTINRTFHLEVDDPKNPIQAMVRDELTKIVNLIPNFDAFKRAQLDATWFGRAGCQWGFKRQEENNDMWGISKWSPVHGDSVQFTFDGIPAILMDSMTTGWYSQNGATWGPNGDLRSTDRGGTALVLQRPYWRDRFSIHRHMMEPADFFEGALAGSIQGLGLRGLVYWHYVIRTDALTWMLAYMQAVGQMDLLVFNFPAGNASAESQQRTNAQQVMGKAAIICPRDPTQNWPAVEQIPMNEAGLKALQQLVADYFDRHIERLIVGQSMSSGADHGTGLGGTGRAEFCRSTKDEILVYDTNRLDATLSLDLISTLKKYNFPWAKFPVRYKSVLPDLEAAEKVQNGVTLISVGVPIKVDELREAAGYARPEEDDEIIGGPPPVQVVSPMDEGEAPSVQDEPPEGPPPGPGLPPGPLPMAAAGPHGFPNEPEGYGAAPYNAPAMGYPGGSNTSVPWYGPRKKPNVGFTRYGQMEGMPAGWHRLNIDGKPRFRRVSLVTVPGSWNRRFEVVEYEPQESLHQPGSYFWKRTYSSHSGTMKQLMDRGFGDLPVGSLHNRKLTPQELDFHKAMAGGPQEQDWRPDQMMPEDFYVNSSTNQPVHYQSRKEQTVVTELTGLPAIKILQMAKEIDPKDVLKLEDHPRVVL